MVIKVSGLTRPQVYFSSEIFKQKIEVWGSQLTPVGIWGGWVSNDMRGGGWFSMGLCIGTMGLVMGANLDPLDFIPFSMISLILPTATNKVS